MSGWNNYAMPSCTTQHDVRRVRESSLYRVGKSLSREKVQVSYAQYSIYVN